MLKKAICLLAICSAATSSELDTLINSSSAIVDQIDKGIRLVGAAQEYSYQGTGMSNGQLSQTAHISSEQLQAYNNALAGMQSYQSYGSVQNVLENLASEELVLMNDAVDTFTEVVVDMIQVVEVTEMAETAASPAEEAEVQEFVAQNQEMLTITQDEVDTYNQSVDDIETHANNASAFIAVAANTEAVGFLEQGAENNNTTAEEATLTYNASYQWVQMSWAGTNNASAVYLNGNNNFGLDLYKTEAEVLLSGSESEFYLTSPIGQGYNCYMYGEDCE
jgi:hypothetical protein